METRLTQQFRRITNSGIAPNKLPEMSQNKGESIAQYHFRLKFHAAKRNFQNQTMRIEVSSYSQ